MMMPGKGGGQMPMMPAMPMGMNPMMPCRAELRAQRGERGSEIRPGCGRRCRGT